MNNSFSSVITHNPKNSIVLKQQLLSDTQNTSLFFITMGTNDSRAKCSDRLKNPDAAFSLFDDGCISDDFCMFDCSLNVNTAPALSAPVTASILARRLLLYHNSLCCMHFFSILPGHLHLILSTGQDLVDVMLSDFMKHTSLQAGKAMNHKGVLWNFGYLKYRLKNSTQMETLTSYLLRELHSIPASRCSTSTPCAVFPQKQRLHIPAHF